MLKLKQKILQFVHPSNFPGLIDFPVSPSLNVSVLLRNVASIDAASRDATYHAGETGQLNVCAICSFAANAGSAVTQGILVIPCTCRGIPPPNAGTDNSPRALNPWFPALQRISRVYEVDCGSVQLLSVLL